MRTNLHFWTLQAASVMGIGLGLAGFCRAQDIPDEIPLWPEGAPQAKGTEAVDTPTVRVYRPEAGKETGAAVVVFPGGGYHIVAIDHEGAQAARDLNRRGITAFVVRYRLKPNYEPEVALLDAQRAVRWVRHHAHEYGVDPNRVGVMGFSAGGHLASNVGTHFDAGNPDAADPVDRQSCRPGFLALCYPVIARELYSGGFVSTDLAVTPDTPPTFLFHTSEDTGVPPENSVRFYQALQKAGVPVELHIFAAGPHGVGLAPGDPEGAGQWPDLMARWLKTGKWLTPLPRVPVSGKLTLSNGEPITWAWVAFIPTGPDADRRPSASAFLPGRADGRFSMDAAHGPCPGPHRVEIWQVGTTLNGSPTMADARNLSGDGLTVDVSPDGENRFEFQAEAP